MILWGNVLSVLIMIFIFGYSLKRYPLKFSNQHVVLVAMLLAVGVILGSYAKISLPLFGPESFEIKFDTIPVMITGIVLGPTWGIVIGIVMDWIQLILYPTGFPFLGFTLNLALTGFFAGVIFYSQENPKRFIQWSLACIAGIALAVLFTVTMTNLFSRNFMLPSSYRWGIGLIMAFVFCASLYGYVHIHKRDLEGAVDRFMARWSYLVILCEITIQLGLTSLWLFILFRIPWPFLLIPRLIEVIPMVLIFMVVGRYLFPLIKRFSKEA